jgi:drug/metabolite transporter (DMT)-like permease
VQTVSLVLLALAGFAINNLFCRAALGPGTMDAASFTAVRLVTAGVVLTLLVRLRGGTLRGKGHWNASAWLLAYAILFSLAYLRVRAGVGALVLFGVVQLTMIGYGLVRGERPRPLEWVGLVVALGGLAVLTWPSAGVPDRLGLLLMAGAGVGWGMYSLHGRAATSPLADTAANFVRTIPFALGLGAIALLHGGHYSVPGILYAAGSGVIGSGIGYAFWYAALPRMTATRGAIVQLSVPVITALVAVPFLGESLSLRLVTAAAAILGGVGLALGARPIPRREVAIASPDRYM